MIKKAITGRFFDATVPLAAAAVAAAHAGFAAYEPILGTEGELSMMTDERTCRTLGAMIRDHGLSISALECDSLMQFPYTSPDPAVRQKACDMTIACLDRAHWLGADTVIVVPGVVAMPSDPARILCSYGNALTLAYESLRDLVVEAEDRAVTIAIKNTHHYFLTSPLEMREFTDRLNSSWAGVYLDLGKVPYYGFAQDWIDILGKRIVGIRVSEYDRMAEGGFNPDRMDAIGWDWRSVAAILRRQYFEGPLSCESTGDLRDMSEWLNHFLAARGA